MGKGHACEYVSRPETYNGSEYLNVCRVTDITRSVNSIHLLPYSYEGLASRLAREPARIDRAGVVSKMNQHKTHTTPLGPAASALEHTQTVFATASQ